jgi:hypothetical protein
MHRSNNALQRTSEHRGRRLLRQSPLTHIAGSVPGRSTRSLAGKQQAHMRIAVIAAIATLALSGTAEARGPEVDLDKPGAMEALQRDRPEHYNKVVEAISKAQTIHVEPIPTTQHASTGTDDPRRKGLSYILPSNPAKSRVGVTVDGVNYRVTAHLTKDPGKFEKAK